MAKVKPRNEPPPKPISTAAAPSCWRTKRRTRRDGNSRQTQAEILLRVSGMTSDPIASGGRTPKFIARACFLILARILRNRSNRVKQLLTLPGRGSRYLGAEDCAWPLRAPLSDRLALK